MRFTIQKPYESLINIKDIQPYQLQIWRWLLNQHINLGERFCNPFRVDQHPDCYLRDSNGILRLVDFPDFYAYGGNFHNKNCIDIIQIKYSCDFKRALQIAYYEALESNITNLPKYQPKKQKKKNPFSLKYQKRSWKLNDKKFWNGTTDITSYQLESEQCFPSKKFWYLNKKGIYVENKPKTETYVNHINDKLKLYQPKNRLFLTNFTNNEIGGFKNFNDSKLLILTKNLKSYLCISNLGYNCRYTPNEGMYLTEYHINYWDTLFDRIIILFDNDEAGIKTSKKLETQWLQVTGNNKAKSAYFNVKAEYKDLYNNTKIVRDAFDICKWKDITNLNKQLCTILNT